MYRIREGINVGKVQRGPSEKYVPPRQFVSIKTATTAHCFSVCDIDDIDRLLTLNQDQALSFTSTRVIPIPTFLWEYTATIVGNGANAVVLYTIIQMTKQYINDMELCDDNASELQVLITPMLQVIWFACKHAT
jgi:hypothetical protein